MKKKLEAAFPDLDWEYMCEDRPEVVGKRSGFTLEVDDLGDGKISVGLSLYQRNTSFTFAKSYITKDPEVAASTAIKDAITKLHGSEIFLLQQLPLTLK